MSMGLSHMRCADSQASQRAAFPTFTCKMAVCSAMLPIAQTEQERGGALGDIKE